MNFRAYPVLLLLTLSCCISLTSYAQDHDHEEHDHQEFKDEDKRHHHQHHKNELSIAVGAVLHERLYLIIYEGARQYYFQKHKLDVEKIIESVNLL